MLIETNTSLSTWTECQKKHEFKYVHNLEPAVEPTALRFGSLVHEILAGVDPLTVPSSLEELEHARMVAGRAPPWPEGWEIEDRELKMKARPSGLRNVRIAGMVDGVLISPSGRRWLVEYKTASKITAWLVTKYAAAQQHLRYAWLYRETTGIEVDGVVYVILSKQAFQRPPLLKSGHLSQDRSLVTTAEDYEAAILEYGLDPVRYQPHIDWLRMAGPQTFHQEWLPIDWAVVDQTAANDRAILNAIRANTERVRNFDACGNFGGCPYKSLCLADQVPLPEGSFRVRSSKHEELESSSKEDLE